MPLVLRWCQPKLDCNKFKALIVISMVTTKKIYTQKEMIKDQDQLNTKEGSDGENKEGEVV